MFIQNLTDKQKEQITGFVDENAEFEVGDLVTVDYTSDDNWFANAEYGGIPLRVRDVTWHGTGLNRVSEASLHHIREDDREDELLELFDEDDVHPDSTKTKYVKVKPSYNLEVTVRSETECQHYIDEPCLIEWDDYEGDLQFHLRRDESGHTSLREGESCVVCGFTAERVAENSLPDGTRYGRTECAVCGYVKEEHTP